MAGALSNLIDRIAVGSVIDFLNVGIGPLRTGIFNLADVPSRLAPDASSGNSSGVFTPRPCQVDTAKCR